MIRNLLLMTAIVSTLYTFPVSYITSVINSTDYEVILCYSSPDPNFGAISCKKLSDSNASLQVEEVDGALYMPPQSLTTLLGARICNISDEKAEFVLVSFFIPNIGMVDLLFFFWDQEGLIYSAYKVEQEEPDIFAVSQYSNCNSYTLVIDQQGDYLPIRSTRTGKFCLTSDAISARLLPNKNGVSKAK